MACLLKCVKDVRQKVCSQLCSKRMRYGATLYELEKSTRTLTSVASATNIAHLVLGDMRQNACASMTSNLAVSVNTVQAGPFPLYVVTGTLDTTKSRLARHVGEEHTTPDGRAAGRAQTLPKRNSRRSLTQCAFEVQLWITDCCSADRPAALLTNYSE